MLTKPLEGIGCLFVFPQSLLDLFRLCFPADTVGDVTDVTERGRDVPFEDIGIEGAIDWIAVER
jgi:hypothetical protein